MPASFSITRVLAAGALAGAVALGGYWTVRQDARIRTIAELRKLNREMGQRLAEREAMIARLSRSHRLAHLHVVDQTWDAVGSVATTTLEFIELDDEGSELDRQRFEVPGAVVFIDAWTVKFGFDQVAQGHPMGGRTLVLLRRVYSDRMAPMDGITIDTPGALPPGYAGSDVGRFEQRVWEQFWDIAGDARVAEALGVRVAQGEAVYKRVELGQRFELTVDAAGGINLVPLPSGAADPTDTTRPS